MHFHEYGAVVFDFSVLIKVLPLQPEPVALMPTKNNKMLRAGVLSMRVTSYSLQVVEGRNIFFFKLKN